MPGKNGILKYPLPELPPVPGAIPVKKIRAILRHDHGHIRNEAQGHQVHAKGRIGEPISGGGLRLKPVELCYLTLKGTIEVYERKRKQLMSASELAQYFEEQKQGFSTRLRAYRELRDRGFFLRLDDEYLNLYHSNKKNNRKLPIAKVFVFREEEHLEIPAVLGKVKKFTGLGIQCWGALVDAEGDVIFFSFVPFREEGTLNTREAQLALVKEMRFLAGKPLPDDGTLEFCFSFSEEGENCFFKSNHPDGVPETLLHSKLFLGKPYAAGLTLAGYEGRYLLDMFKREPALCKFLTTSPTPAATEGDPFQDGPLDELYRELKARWLVPKSGFKFGTHFRAYTGLEEGHHAEFLIHLLKKPNVSWYRLECMVRLATGVNKELVLAFREKEDGPLKFLKILREVPSPGKE